MAHKDLPPQVTGVITRVRQSILVGLAAGSYTLTGIQKDHDRLLSVILVKLALAEGAPNTLTWTVSDLTSQFTVTAANTINNSGGTAGTGGFLIVQWYDTDFGFASRPF